jgi:hypothetical protein
MKALRLLAALTFCLAACGFSVTYAGLVHASSLWPLSQQSGGDTKVGSIPVLLYHGIVSPGDKADNSVTLSAFTAQMAYLHDHGYQSISPAQYTAWYEGKHPALPAHPVLITFDCNQTSALLTQPVLKKYGFRPVMYVVSGFADHAYGDYYMTWYGLRQLASEGWYMQFHAGPCGHGYITTDTPYNCDYNGTFTFTADAKIGHRYYSQTFGQSPAQYHARVAKDVAIGMQEIAKVFPDQAGTLSDTFAVPWSDYGQPETSNIGWLGQYFASQWSVVFIQNNFPGKTLASASARKLHLAYRFEVDEPTTMGQFMTALADTRFSLR